jgi:hypothetical protein
MKHRISVMTRSREDVDPSRSRMIVALTIIAAVLLAVDVYGVGLQLRSMQRDFEIASRV